jgi:hypothetical protein
MGHFLSTLSEASRHWGPLTGAMANLSDCSLRKSTHAITFVSNVTKCHQLRAAALYRGRFILVGDAGCGKDFAFEDLGNAVRRCRSTHLIAPALNQNVEHFPFAVDRPPHIHSLTFTVRQSNWSCGFDRVLRRFRAIPGQTRDRWAPFSPLPVILDNFSWSFSPKLQAL